MPWRQDWNQQQGRLFLLCLQEMAQLQARDVLS